MRIAKTMMVLIAILTCLDLVAAVPRKLAPTPMGSGSMVLGPYTYDGSGNIIAVGTDTYWYDIVGRLKSATAGTNNVQTYTYDIYGNRTAAERGVGSSNCTGNEACEKPSLTIEPTTNRIACSGTAPCYDAAGNFTRGDVETYVYDAAGMMT
jgi:YD repeat-containing protein